MEPIKIKILKRVWTDDDKDLQIPHKKRLKDKEKENKNSEHGNVALSKLRSRNKVLENSPVPNAKISARENESSDDEVDSVFDEMLLQLRKSGIKISDSNKSPFNNSAEGRKGSSSKKKNVDSSSPSQIKKIKSKKALLEEFEQLNDNDKKEKLVVKLEKIPEDLSVNHKSTSKNVVKYQSCETQKEQESFETPRRSIRRRSSILNETVTPDSQKTPLRRRNSETPDKKSTPLRRRNHETPDKTNTPLRSSDKTPRKSPLIKKEEPIEPKTPTLRTTEQLPTTPLEKARVSLHVSSVPDCLPCREKEYSNILTFVENKLLDGIGGCMYISGVPGTGKTATVTQVIRRLQECCREGKLPEFKYIEINGMRLANPRQAYVQLWQKLFDKKERIIPERAQRLLDEWFSKRDKQNVRKTTVLLVDELDLICTKKQDVVYNLLDWPTRTHSRLVVLTIANTMDMPERLFKGRVTSRMGLTRLTFMPYTHKQLEEIVLARLNGLDAFVNDAVRLVTRKVAAVSGDARRALDICRRATELPAPDETVKISHIEQAIKEMTNSNIVKVIRNCGEMEKLFLRSLSDVSSRSNVEEIDLREVIDQLYALCVLEGITRPSISSVLSVSNRLKCCRLIFSNQSSGGVLQRLTLNVTQDDIHYALRT